MFGKRQRAEAREIRELSERLFMNPNSDVLTNGGLLFMHFRQNDYHLSDYLMPGNLETETREGLKESLDAAVSDGKKGTLRQAIIRHMTEQNSLGPITPETQDEDFRLRATIRMLGFAYEMRHHEPYNELWLEAK